MSDVKRELIGSVQLGQTKSGKVKADLYSTNKRLEYPALTLFDLSMLETVGIDPNKLDSGPIHKRFWGYYIESDKKTSRGNNYRDVQYLEIIDNGNGTTVPPMDDAMVAAILKELKAQTKLLKQLAGAVADPVEEGDWLPSPGKVLPPEEEQEPTIETGDLPEPGHESWDDPIPPNSEGLVQWLNPRVGGVECSSPGHLLFGIKKMRGEDWGWPITTDESGWRDAAEAWLEFVRTH